jgi:hypothetical protein
VLFENRMQKAHSPACASFLVIAQWARSSLRIYFRFFRKRQTPLKNSGANARMINVNAEGKVSIKHSVESLFYPNLPLAFCSAIFA